MSLSNIILVSMKEFESHYKTIIINHLPLVYHFASSKDYNTIHKDDLVTYKVIESHGLNKQRVFPFYKLISKIKI